MDESLTYELREAAAIITFTRPEIYNPIDEVSGLELVSALEKAGRDERVRAVILIAQGKAFSAGGNIRLMAEYLAAHPEAGASPLFARILDYFHRSILAIRQMPKPVIAAVGGVAAGGGLGWIMASDLVLAAPEARFDTAYIRIAVSPDGSNTYFLPRLVGTHKAAELLFLGQTLSAEEALSAGLINRIVPAKRLLEESLDLAGQLAQRSASALARTKALLNASLDSTLAQQLEAERQGLLDSMDEPDFREAIEAFFAAKKDDKGSSK